MEALPLLASLILRGHLRLASRRTFPGQGGGGGRDPCCTIALRSRREGRAHSRRHEKEGTAFLYLRSKLRWFASDRASACAQGNRQVAEMFACHAWAPAGSLDLAHQAAFAYCGRGHDSLFPQSLFSGLMVMSVSL